MGTPGYPKDVRDFVGSDDEAMKYSNVIVMSARLKGTTFFIGTTEGDHFVRAL